MAEPFHPLHAGIEQLLQSLEQLENGYLQGKEEDLAFLRDMLKTPEFHSLLQVSTNFRGSGVATPLTKMEDKITVAYNSLSTKDISSSTLFLGTSCGLRGDQRGFPTPGYPWCSHVGQ